MRERDKVRESFTGKGSLGGKRRFMCGLKWFMGVDSEARSNLEESCGYIWTFRRMKCEVRIGVRGE